MDTINFTRMEDGTVEEYALTSRLFHEHVAETHVDHLFHVLNMMKGPTLGYRVDRYEHSLQSATRAQRDGADEETVVCALLHDIGDILAPANHSQIAAGTLRPYVSEKNYWIVKHHGLFQGYYFFDKIGGDKNAREAYRDHPHFDDCERFCYRWDQCSFDPDYDTQPLSFFEPMVRRVFSEKRESFS